MGGFEGGCFGFIAVFKNASLSLTSPASLSKMETTICIFTNLKNQVTCAKPLGYGSRAACEALPWPSLQPPCSFVPVKAKDSEESCP